MRLALNLSHLVPELHSRPQEDECFLFKAGSLDSVFCVVSNITPQPSRAAQERPWVIYKYLGAAVCQQTLLTKWWAHLVPRTETVGQYKILTLESGWELGEMQASKAFASHDNHKIWSVLLITDTIPFCRMYVPIIQKHRAWWTTEFPEDPPSTRTSSSTQHFLM